MPEHDNSLEVRRVDGPNDRINDGSVDDVQANCAQYQRCATTRVKRAFPIRRIDGNQNVEALKPIQRTLYSIIKEYVTGHGEPIPPSELYAEYQDRVENPVGDRQVRRHLNKLERYELVDIQGSSRNRRYGLTGQPE